MNRVTHASCLLLLVAGCGGELLSSAADGKDPTDASVSLPDSQLIVDGYVDIDVTGQSCVVGTLCPNGVTCLDGSCQTGNCRWDWDCYSATCTHGWCTNCTEYGPWPEPSIEQCLEQSDANAGYLSCTEVLSVAMPLDGGRVTDCREYPEAGAMCNCSSCQAPPCDGLQDLYCWEYSEFGVCIPTLEIPIASELVVACQQTVNGKVLCALPELDDSGIGNCEGALGSGVCTPVSEVPIDGGSMTDCRDYPDAGVICELGSGYCQELDDLGACVHIKWVPPHDQ